MGKASILIRAKNEERWITSCLDAVFQQDYPDFEVLLVDNDSTDLTVEKAQKYDLKVIQIEDYLPGKALNLGFRHSKGEYLVALSAHCIPKNKYWLAGLIKNLEDPDVAGVYGKQEPMAFTNDLDKRDLYTVFGLDRRVQIKDSFFHNANSAIRREVWEKYPFDENLSNIEDRIWGQLVINEGYKIIYEPDAVVFHHHGIHQGMDEQRCHNVVRILEKFQVSNVIEADDLDDITSRLKVVGVIALKGEMEYLAGKPLIQYTIDKVRESEFIGELVVSSDNEEIIAYCESHGVEHCILRPKELSKESVGVEQVLQYTMSRLETEMGILPDLVVYLGVHSPFRPKGLIDKLIRLHAHTGADSVFPGFPTYKSCWYNNTGAKNGVKRIDDGFVPRSMKNPVHIGFPGLACVTLPSFLRQGHLLGDRVEISEIIDFYSTLEIKDGAGRDLAERIFSEWWEENA